MPEQLAFGCSGWWGNTPSSLPAHQLERKGSEVSLCVLSKQRDGARKRPRTHNQLSAAALADWQIKAMPASRNPTALCWAAVQAQAEGPRQSAHRCCGYRNASNSGHNTVISCWWWQTASPGQAFVCEGTWKSLPRRGASALTVPRWWGWVVGRTVGSQGLKDKRQRERADRNMPVWRGMGLLWPPLLCGDCRAVSSATYAAPWLHEDNSSRLWQASFHTEALKKTRST